MIKKLLPILLALVGTAAGVGAGILLKPAPPPPEEVAAPAEGEEAAAEAPTEEEAPAEDAEAAPPASEFVKLNNQFIIPIMGDSRVRALVVASLSVEVLPGRTEIVYAREPKLRDVFLQVLFDHANIGGFDGAFTSSEKMDILRRALLDAARSVLGRDALDVLITEIARQDT